MKIIPALIWILIEKTVQTHSQSCPLRSYILNLLRVHRISYEVAIVQLQKLDWSEKKIVSSSTEVRYQGTSASRLNNLESFFSFLFCIPWTRGQFFLILIHESPIKHVLSRVLYTTTSNNVWNNNSLKNPRRPRILLMHLYINSLLNFVSTLNK